MVEMNSQPPQQPSEMSPEMQSAYIQLGTHILTIYGYEEQVNEEVTFRGKTLVSSHFLLHDPARDKIISAFARRQSLPEGDPQRDNIDGTFRAALKEVFEPQQDKDTL